MNLQFYPKLFTFHENLIIKIIKHIINQNYYF